MCQGTFCLEKEQMRGIRMGKYRLMIVLEVRWRLVLHYRKRIGKLIKNGEKLNAASVVHLGKKINKHLNSILDSQARYEAITRKVLKFYGNRNREPGTSLNIRANDSDLIQGCTK
jgi:hypothetical protein